MSASPRLPHDDPGEDPYLLTLSSALPPPRALKDRGGAPWSLLLQQVTVRPGKIWQYQLFMVSTYRVWLRRAGFQMLAAGSYLTGAPGRLLHLWYVPPALAEGALAEQPAFLQHYREELIEHEETTTLAPAAYDPDRDGCGVSREEGRDFAGNCVIARLHGRNDGGSALHHPVCWNERGCRGSLAGWHDRLDWSRGCSGDAGRKGSGADRDHDQDDSEHPDWSCGVWRGDLLGLAS